MDLLKHGESAYPADAWVEQQYMDDSNGSWSPSHKSGEFLPTQIKFCSSAQKKRRQSGVGKLDYPQI